MKKKPLRTCIICRQKKEKNRLLRIVRDKNTKTVFFDRSGKANGRGCYVCDSSECIEKVLSPGLIRHHLNVEVTKDELGELREQLTEYIREVNV